MIIPGDKTKVLDKFWYNRDQVILCMKEWGCPMRRDEREAKGHPCQQAHCNRARVMTQADPINSPRQGKVTSQVWGPPRRQKYLSHKSEVHTGVRARGRLPAA